ncbi:MAG: hypothetical protein KTR31_17965 [Myxococcales bacterium]|nr:hypothetical protein [Myxococcales bacterium]
MARLMISFVVGLSACAPGPRVVETQPDAEAVDVSVIEPVVFHFDRTIDASDAQVRWNPYGDNDRLPTRIEVDERSVTVFPLQEPWYGTRQEVVLTGVQSKQGTLMEPARARFRTAANPMLTYWTRSLDGAYTGNGIRCSVDDRRRPTACDEWINTGTGTDGLPGSEDDPVTLRREYTWSGDLATEALRFVREGDTLVPDGVTTWSYTDRDYVDVAEVWSRGPDRQLGTDDDDLVASHYSFDDLGFRTERRWGDPGADGVFSEEEVWVGVAYLVDPRGHNLGWTASEDPGPDEQYFTDDDVHYEGFVTEVDDDGFWLSGERLDPGEDQWVPSDDDVLQERYDYLYDESGFLVERIVPFSLSFGASRITWTRNPWGQTVRWTDHWVGGDFEWGTADDEILDYTARVYDSRGQRLRSTRFGAPGPDGEWYTDDDVVAEEWTFAP